jgi:hypothetical protein
MSVILHISKECEIPSQTLRKGRRLKIILKESLEANISAKEMESATEEETLAQ